MTTNSNINPALLLEAAKIAKPHEPWQLVNGRPAFDVSTFSETYEKWRFFDPLTNDTDLKALMLALEREGWEFYYVAPVYLAYLREHQKEVCSKDPAMRLLKCVSAQTGIKLEV